MPFRRRRRIRVADTQLSAAPQGKVGVCAGLPAPVPRLARGRMSWYGAPELNETEVSRAKPCNCAVVRSAVPPCDMSGIAYRIVGLPW